MNVEEFTRLMLAALIGCLFHLGFLALSDMLGGTDDPESKLGRITGAIRTLTTILFLISPLLIILCKVALS